MICESEFPRVAGARTRAHWGPRGSAGIGPIAYHTASLSLIASLGAFTRSCFVPRILLGGPRRDPSLEDNSQHTGVRRSVFLSHGSAHLVLCG